MVHVQAHAQTMETALLLLARQKWPTVSRNTLVVFVTKDRVMFPVPPPGLVSEDVPLDDLPARSLSWERDEITLLTCGMPDVGIIRMGYSVRTDVLVVRESVSASSNAPNHEVVNGHSGGVAGTPGQQ